MLQKQVAFALYRHGNRLSNCCLPKATKLGGYSAKIQIQLLFKSPMHPTELAEAVEQGRDGGFPEHRVHSQPLSHPHQNYPKSNRISKPFHSTLNIHVIITAHH
jgi:hypothetical protein